MTSARALTGVSYGAIVTIDESGQPEDFVFSGLTSDEHRSLIVWPDALLPFKHLRDVPGPLRVPDLAAYAKSLGFSFDLVPLATFQVTSTLHRGVRVGNFCLGQKEGGTHFIDADEEVLVLFASQAAAMANARTYRDERRARADLEALVDASPVGVAVFEATAHPRASHPALAQALWQRRAAMTLLP